MANTTENSFSELIENFTILQNNAFLVLQKISESVTSEADELQFTLVDVNKDNITYQLPSYKSIKKDIKRIDETLKTMLGLNESGRGVVRNADGSYSAIYKTSLISEPEKIQQLEIPSYFNVKSNWFFENFLNPLLYISFDASKYIPQDESKICVRRLILTKDANKTVQESFDRLFLGRNDIKYADFLKWCSVNSIAYTLDEDIQDLPLSQLRYFGDFIVRKIDDLSITNTSGVIGTERRYYLDKITYSDSMLDIKENFELKVDQKLSINTSVYKITSVDSSIRAITLDRVSGYDGIIEGSTLKLFSEPVTPKMINVNVSINEREVIFFKSINDESNIISREWSDGIGIYTDLLQIQTDNGVKSLPEYYDSFVYDYGQQLIGLSKENKMSAFYALKPNTPEPVRSDFEVVQINKHLMQNDVVANINNLIRAMKISKNDISKYSDDIADTKKSLYETTTIAEDQRNEKIKEIHGNIEKKKKAINEYISNAEALKEAINSNPLPQEDAKFRIRGFFNMPAPQYLYSTGTQNIIQFEVRYCYASKNDTNSSVQEYSISGKNGEVITAQFTNWNYYKTPVRKKEWDAEKGIYVWSKIDVNDGLEEKPNQIDIPITKNEIVKFQIRSISEAGYPENPQYSDWSNEISVEFPEVYETTDITKIAQDVIKESQTYIEIENALKNDGYEDHIKDAFKMNEMIWSHSAETIHSGFYKDDGVIISLYEKLKKQDALIEELRNKIEAAKAKLVVKLVDKIDNTTTTIQDGDVVRPKDIEYSTGNTAPGDIVRREYEIKISNSVAGSTLELISLCPGHIADSLEPDDINNYSKYNTENKNYHKCPLSILKFTDASEINDTEINHKCFSNKQVPGQFIYLRHKSLDGAKLYSDKQNVIVDTKTVYEGPYKEIWNRAFDENGTPIGNGAYTNFCVQINHPLLSSRDNAWGRLSTATGSAYEDCLIDPMKIINGITDSSNEFYEKKIYPAFIQVDTTTETNKFSAQAEYKENSSYYNGIKCAFDENDKYLIGDKTRNAFFYVSVKGYNLLRVGNSTNDVKKLESSGDSITIPLVYECRHRDICSFRKTFTSSYIRRLGFDISTITGVFSFDVEVKSTCNNYTDSETTSEETPESTPRKTTGPTSDRGKSTRQTSGS